MQADVAVIEVRDLCKTYRDGLLRRRQVQALRGATLRTGRGQIFGLLGPNGAGKTTLIKILLGIVRETDGEASLLGRPAGDRHARRDVGFLPENPRIPEHLTGDTALEYYGALSGLKVSEIRRKRPAIYDTVGLPRRWGKTLVRRYSKGMLQRLGLAQALFHDPQLLILDEPTDGVDPVGRTEIRDVLKGLQQRGKTVFLNSHLLQEVELVCDRVAILQHGRVLRVGSVDEITHGSAETDSETEALLSVSADDSEAVRRALAEFPSASVTDSGESGFAISVRLPDGAALDGVIDALRRDGISIYAASRRRVSLEEAFVELVKEGGRDAGAAQ